MAKQKGLGRGLDALLGSDEITEDSNGLRMLSVNQMQSGQYQPRTHMDQAALQTLADSIKQQGVMQPILVREISPDRYEIIAGERRWRASQIAGLEEVPVIIREIEDASALEIALIENIQRENLNPIEEAIGIKRLIDEFSMTHEKAANAVGRSRVAVSNLLRLLTLADAVQSMVIENKIDMGHARALIGLEPAQQVMIATKVAQQHLSVREVEALVKKSTANNHAVTEKKQINHDVMALENSLSERLGTGVSISAKANGSGTLKINYSSLDQLDALIKTMTD